MIGKGVAGDDVTLCLLSGQTENGFFWSVHTLPSSSRMKYRLTASLTVWLTAVTRKAITSSTGHSFPLMIGVGGQK